MTDKQDVEWLITTILMIYFEMCRSRQKEKPSKRPGRRKKRKR